MYVGFRCIMITLGTPWIADRNESRNALAEAAATQCSMYTCWITDRNKLDLMVGCLVVTSSVAVLQPLPHNWCSVKYFMKGFNFSALLQCAMIRRWSLIYVKYHATNVCRYANVIIMYTVTKTSAPYLAVKLLSCRKWSMVGHVIQCWSPQLNMRIVNSAVMF